MNVRYPHHSILVSLLEKKQYEACRTTVEDLIAEQIGAAEPDDLELAHLHIFLCRALQGEQRYELAGDKADIAAFLARKLKEWDMVGEALYRAGFSNIQAGQYRRAVERFTACLEFGDDLFKAKAHFNRGHAYQRQKAYTFAVRDFQEAIQLAVEHDPNLVRICRINLAWGLITLGDFDKAEAVLDELTRPGGAEPDQYTQLQIAHDRLHISFLKGNGGDALRSAVTTLREVGQADPEVRARIVQTIMMLAIDQGLPEQGFVLGVLTKRMAGQAERIDIDTEVGSQMEALEFEAGTDRIAQALRRMGQVTPGGLNRRRPYRREQRSGGVG